MNRKILGSIVVMFGLVIAVGLGAVAYYSASAAGAAPSQAAYSVNGHGKGFGDATGEYLAEALGITVDELTAAKEQAHSAVMAQAVEQGLITQAQADQLETRGRAFPLGRLGQGWLVENGIDNIQGLFAEALGISVEELNAAQEQAFETRLAQAVSDGELTQEQADLIQGQHALAGDENFQAAMQTAFQESVEQAVEDSVITQAQADQILERGSRMRFLGGDRPGGRGGHCGPGFRSVRGIPPSESTPLTTP